MKNREYIYKLTCIVLIIDQSIKLLVNSKMNIYQSVVVIKNFFSITYVKNTGAAFSILSNSTTFLSILSVIFILILDNFIKKDDKMNRLTSTSLGLVMGGIFGNLLDRVMYHAVIDYLSFKIISYNFPIFNIADICICVGIGLYIISSIIEKDTKENE